jgi:hypothetical protein
MLGGVPGLPSYSSADLRTVFLHRIICRRLSNSSWIVEPHCRNLQSDHYMFGDQIVTDCLGGEIFSKIGLFKPAVECLRGKRGTSRPQDGIFCQSLHGDPDHGIDGPVDLISGVEMILLPSIDLAWFEKICFCSDASKCREFVLVCQGIRRLIIWWSFLKLSFDRISESKAFRRREDRCEDIYSCKSRSPELGFRFEKLSRVAL